MILYIFLFLAGLCVGSFLNSVIYRLETGESIIAESRGTVPRTRNFVSIRGRRGTTRKLSRSHCPHCETILKWYDLAPVLSFLFLRGKCRYCGKRISWQYPAVEITTGLIFLLISNFQFPIFKQITNFQFSISNIIDLLYWFYIVSVLIVIFVYDFKHYIIPDKIIFPAIAVSIMYHVISIMYGQNYTLYIILHTLYNYAGSAFAASAFFLLLVLVSRGKWMGLGDVKLAFLMGLVLGWPNILVALFLSFFFGAAVGVALILSGSKTLKSQIPFGPFLIAGTFVALFWGERIVGWYWGLLF